MKKSAFFVPGDSKVNTKSYLVGITILVLTEPQIHFKT